MTKDFMSTLALSRRGLLRAGLATSAAVALGGRIDTAAWADDGPPKAGGTLRIAVPGGTLDSLDPHRTQGQVSDSVRCSNLFDGLAENQPDASVTLSMAQSITADDSLTEWTVRLREGIMLHDGREFTADDLIFSVERILDPAHSSKGAALVQFVDPAALRKIDSHTVVFKLKSPHALFKEVWANTYLRMVPRGFDPAAPVGTGPFKYVSFTPGRESVFERFDGYFREKAWVDTLVVTVINDNTAALNALRVGQVDISYTMPFSEARIVAADPSLRILNNPIGMEVPIYMRTDMPPFDDVRVRQAMRLIADREQIVKVALAGYGTVGNDMAGRSIAPCTESSLPQRRQDLEAARRLLTEAGKPDFAAELVTVNGTAGMIECAQVFAEQARAAGVSITVRVMEVGAYLANYGGWSFGVDFLADNYLTIATLSRLPTGTFNTTRWNDAEFNALYAEAVATGDPAARCAIIEKMRAIEYERGGYLLWGFSNELNGYRSNVQGLLPHSVDSAMYHLRKAWLS